MAHIRCILEEAAAISKNQAGIVQGERFILYSEWNDLASAVADRLKAAGIREGDRIGIFMANDWRLLVLLTGIIRAGAITCPISTRLPRPAVISHLKSIGANRLIAYLGKTKPQELEGLEVLSPDALLSTPQAAAARDCRMELDRPAVIVFTSGSGAQPKAAVLTYGNLYYNARGANANIRVASTSRWLLNLPMYHVSGLGVLFRCLLAGACVVVPDANDPLSDAIQKGKPTHISLVPSQLADLLESGMAPAPELKAALVGGSACDPVLAEKARSQKWPVYLSYGLTEAGSQVATMPPEAKPDKRISTSGKVLRHRELTIAADGEILIKGPCLFAGYWINGRLDPARDSGGWYHTGDIGFLDADGFLIVKGRKDFLIISGGENIQPEEIEMALREVPSIEDVVVTSIPHARYGQRPVAFVRAGSFKPKQWTEFLKQRLPAFKVPDAFYPWPPEGAQPPGLKSSRAWFARQALAVSGQVSA